MTYVSVTSRSAGTTWVVGPFPDPATARTWAELTASPTPADPDTPTVDLGSGQPITDLSATPLEGSP